MAQIPHGPKDLKCPLWRKKMSDVCHTCPWWCQVRGKNPQSREEVDRWDCSLSLLPMLQIETSQQARQAGAATESMRNALVATHIQLGEAKRYQAPPLPNEQPILLTEDDTNDTREH